MPSPQRCVYCRQHVAEERFKPFCSERCKMADLGRWLTGAYQVPGPAASGPDRPEANEDEFEDQFDDDGRIR